MNLCHTWRLYYSSLKILVELEISKTSSHILVGKESLSNRKFTSQRKVNNKICRAYSDLYRKSFPNFNSSENLSQHRTIPLGFQVKFQLDPTVEFSIMLKSVKLDSKNFYDKISIWPYLNCIKWYVKFM